jgi:mitogen-activated protein kinase kinase 1 interacting protein 1
MAEDLYKYFTQLMDMVDGINAIVVTDREGVSVLQVKALPVIDASLRPQVLSIPPMTMEQAGKLGLGQTKTIIVISEDSQMISFNKMPLTVTVMAEKSANTGHILALEADFNAAVQQMKQVIENGNN